MAGRGLEHDGFGIVIFRSTEVKKSSIFSPSDSSKKEKVKAPEYIPRQREAANLWSMQSSVQSKER
jgi:hypothetical protein